MSNLPPPSLQAGWFPDPDNEQLERYWDGNRWTDLTDPLAPSELAGAPAVPGGWYDDPMLPETQRYWNGSAWSEHRRAVTQLRAASNGFATAALIVGIVAFLSGLAPVWGIIVGGTAVVLGAIALVRKQSKGLALTGLILGGIGALTSLVATIALFAGVASWNESGSTQTPVTVESSEPAAEPAPEAPSETVSRVNAARSAQNYLDFTGFSRAGLIDQLEFDGFSTEDATFGADAVGANWNEQAARKAESYLDFTSFSRSGLIDQLKFDGFSAGEAEFGVNSVGL